MLVKSLLLVVLTTSFGFLGLLGISTNFLHTETILTPGYQTIQSKSDSVYDHSGFEKIAGELKNSAIDYSSIEKERVEKINYMG